MKTKVKFLLEKGSNTEVFAYFPNIIHSVVNNTRVSYSHIGQHTACSPSYANCRKPASPKQYAALKKELESTGYDLTII